jgi:hypothetical protein
MASELVDVEDIQKFSFYLEKFSKFLSPFLDIDQMIKKASRSTLLPEDRGCSQIGTQKETRAVSPRIDMVVI